ncbi:hypothetical protein N7G274_008831 [Stereocaulon virgatum]|uniref:Secreted protein n=1 Tax=Stereocaulon virgatum TaxID=373712 RepID=A0ABR4A2A5_9LECA
MLTCILYLLIILELRFTRPISRVSLQLPVSSGHMQFVLFDRVRTALARHSLLRSLSHLPDVDEHLHNILFAYCRDSIFEASHPVFRLSSSYTLSIGFEID